MKITHLAKNVVLAMTLAVATAHAAGPAIASSTASVLSGQKIVVTMSHGTDNLANAFMAIGMANMFAKKGNTVKVFLNLESVRIADKRQPLDLKYGKRTENYEKIFNDFIAAGGEIVVCPKCAAVAGVTQENLRKGATIGNPELVSTMFLEADKIIGY